MTNKYSPERNRFSSLLSEDPRSLGRAAAELGLGHAVVLGLLDAGFGLGNLIDAAEMHGELEPASGQAFESGRAIVIEETDLGWEPRVA